MADIGVCKRKFTMEKVTAKLKGSSFEYMFPKIRKEPLTLCLHSFIYF